MTNKKTSTKKTWEDLTPEEKKTGTIAAIVIGLIILVFIIGIAVSVNSSSNDSKIVNNADGNQSTEENSNQDWTDDTTKKLTVMNIADEAIASSADGGNCYVEYIEPDESVFASVSSMGSAATYYFVESAKQVFASGKCSSKYTFAYSMNGESSRGSTQKFTLGIFATTPDQFEVFDWSSLSGTSVGEVLRRNNMLNIPRNVSSQIDYKDFKYNG